MLLAASVALATSLSPWVNVRPVKLAVPPVAVAVPNEVTSPLSTVLSLFASTHLNSSTVLPASAVTLTDVVELAVPTVGATGGVVSAMDTVCALE